MAYKINSKKTKSIEKHLYKLDDELIKKFGVKCANPKCNKMFIPHTSTHVFCSRECNFRSKQKWREYREAHKEKYDKYSSDYGKRRNKATTMLVNNHKKEFDEIMLKLKYEEKE